MDKCPVCKKRPKLKAAYKKANTNKDPVVARLLSKLCERCKQNALNRLGNRPTDKDVKELYAIVNGLLTSAEVRQIRKNLNLTQKEAARICGGGPNAFSRYERGEAVPIRATSNLLRLLNKYPQEVDYLLDFCPGKN